MKIEFLDHVAVRFADMEASANWYEEVLGLKKYKLPEWGDFPILFLSVKSGIAVFPANKTDTVPEPTSKNVKIDPFAFNVTKENFDKAQKRLPAVK